MQALIVDNSASVRALLKRMLVELGIAVATAGSGSEALAKMAQAAPDVVLISAHAPGMNGLALLREIRRQPHYASLKVFLLIAESYGAGASLALAAGADACLSMPFTPEMVDDALRLAGLAPLPLAFVDQRFEPLEAGIELC